MASRSSRSGRVSRCARKGAKGFAFQQLRDQIRRAVVSADVVHGEDVGVVEGAGGLRFDGEAAHPVGVGREGRAEHLEGHVALETGVAGAVDFAHSAFAKLRFNSIWTEAGANHARALSRHRRSPSRESRSGLGAKPSISQRFVWVR
jgi:hypothetical protein